MLENGLATIPVFCDRERMPNKQEIDFSICPHSREAVAIIIKNPSCDCYVRSACAFMKPNGIEAFCQKIPKNHREAVRKGLTVLMKMVNEPANKLPC
ncbi:MAG: hypothetical protein ABIE14_03710 [Patescibacteria group bacterium]